MNLKSVIREVPDFPKKGILFYDITTLLQDPAAFKQCIEQLYSLVKGMKIDKIAAIESRGYIFGAPLALKLNCGLVVIRKPGKLPYKKLSESYDLEYGSSTIEMHEDAIKKGEKVLLIDDLLATGGTMKAAINLVEKVGGVVTKILFVIELDFLNGIQKLEGYDAESLLHYDK
ncbi:MAG: adenine phosphoribosyltransferase [archaeon]